MPKENNEAREYFHSLIRAGNFAAGERNQRIRNGASRAEIDAWPTGGPGVAHRVTPLEDTRPPSENTPAQE